MTPARSHFDVDEIRTRLSGETVLETYALRQLRTGRRRGRCYRLAECPRCHHSSRRGAIVVYIREGVWKWRHHGGGDDCGGSMLDLVAVLEGLDTRHDWPRVLELCASLAGITPNECISAEERSRRAAARAEHLRREREAEAAADRERRRAAAGERDQLDDRHPIGEAYLRTRRLDPDAHRTHVRYADTGDVCVGLYSLNDGGLVTVTRRLLVGPAWDPTRKIHTPTGGTTRGTLCGRIIDLVRPMDVIVTEGIIDTLTAIELWPHALTLGAAGAGQLRNVVEAVAPRVRRHGGRLLIVPDRDDIGQARAAEAVRVARAAGLAPHHDLDIVDVAPHHDLNDAHCAGWTP